MPPKKTHFPTDSPAVSIEVIERRIYLIRGHKVMLDADLADLYQVETRALNQAVRRNADRFPDDFMFQLTAGEAAALRSQSVILEKGRGRHSKYAPLAFTEHGVAMLSSVLHSARAVQMNILIIRAFVKLREWIATHKDLARKVEGVERTQKKQGRQIAAILQHLIDIPERPKRPIGFQPPADR